MAFESIKASQSTKSKTEDEVRNKLLGYEQIIELPKTINQIRRETGEVIPKTIRHLTFEPTSNLDLLLKNIRINLFDNGDIGSKNTSPHRFEIEFSLDRKVAGLEAGTYIDLLDHCLLCKLGSDNGIKNFNKYKEREDIQPKEKKWLSSIYDVFADLVCESLGKKRGIRLPKGSGDHTKIWPRVLKTATKAGLTGVPYSAACWIGDPEQKFKGALYIFFNLSIYQIDIAPLERPLDVNKDGKRTDRKLVASGQVNVK